MIDWPVIATALGLGLLGGGHCIGMCGGIMGALTFAIPADARGQRLMLLLHYNVGRISSYTLMGLLLGIVGGLASAAGGLGFLRIIAGALLIAMGLYLADWWRGLSYLEKLGGNLWRRLQPLGKSLMPVKSPLQALALGSLWGWLPCGLVYSALAFAASQGSALNAAAVMLAFGMGTLPAVLASGIFAERLQAIIRHKQLRNLFAVFVIVFGVWTLWGSLGHSGHQNHTAAPTEGEHSHHHH